MSEELSEETLVTRLRSQDEVAFEALFLRHNPAMMRVAAAILGSRASAEEVAQETWLSVLRNIDGFEGRGSFAGWLFTILGNKARTRARRDGRSVGFDDDGPDGLDGLFRANGSWAEPVAAWDHMTAERLLDDKRLLAAVFAAIEKLPPAQRAVLVLRAQQGLSTEEVCRALEIAPGNMRVLLHRARTSLRRELDALSD